ncbi:hypothetical protein ACFY7H_03085 [Streptomyces sp. NPDC012794]|uniref:hypothetical protein n=1 Tax=Streptomyces sp. NPDC012794 TaxID=3364850 RepID=UPI00367F76D8
MAGSAVPRRVVRLPADGRSVTHPARAAGAVTGREREDRHDRVPSRRLRYGRHRRGAAAGGGGPLPYEAEAGARGRTRIPPGRFAYDPRPSAYSWEPGPSRQSGRVPAGPPRSIVLSPGDARGMTPATYLGSRGGCCGPDGLGGANPLCTGCSDRLAIESADCRPAQQIVLDPRRVSAAPEPGRPAP